MTSCPEGPVESEQAGEGRDNTNELGDVNGDPVAVLGVLGEDRLVIVFVA